MKQIQPDIWQTEVENPAKSLYAHAYLLLRDEKLRPASGRALLIAR